jgi:hypothetical protein
MYFLVAFGLSFTIYLFTLAPTIYNLDSAEFTTAAATLGLTRSTGYPLYILLGNLWSKIPLGDVGFRLNLFSAFCGALTIGLMAVILNRHFHVKGWAAFGALGLFATGKFFWALSSIAEVYTLQTALMAGLILCLLRWQEQPTARCTVLLGFILGLCLCHHAGSILMIPGVLVFILTSVSKTPSKPKIFGAGIIGLLLGLVPYLYLPLRYHSLPEFNYAGVFDARGLFHPFELDTVQGLWTLISGKTFSSVMFAYSGREVIQEIILFSGGLWQAFLIIGIGPGLAGAIILFKRNRRMGFALLLMFIFHAIFFINYRVVDKEVMFLPCYLIWALWLGLGYQWLEELILKTEEYSTQKQKYSISSIVLWCLRGLIILVIVFSFFWKYKLVDQSDNWSTRQLGEQILAQVEPNALIFGYWDVVPVIEYLTLVEGKRPDVQPVNRFLVSQDDLKSWIVREISLRPIYIDHPISDLPKNIRSVDQGDLYRLLQDKP